MTSDQAAFLLRFVLGGLLIACVPLVARRFSLTVGSIAILTPVVTILSLYFIGRDLGMSKLGPAAARAAFALPTLLVLLLTIYGMTNITSNVYLILIVGLAAWLLSVIPLIILLRG
jgi:uncharacterized membrane protein (GlpM family)